MMRQRINGTKKYQRVAGSLWLGLFWNRLMLLSHHLWLDLYVLNNENISYWMAGLKATDQDSLWWKNTFMTCFLDLFEFSPAMVLNAARINLALPVIQIFDYHHNINSWYHWIYYIIFCHNLKIWVLSTVNGVKVELF